MCFSGSTLINYSFQALETIPEELGEFNLDSMVDGLAEEAASRSQGLLGLWRRAVGMVAITEIRKVVLVTRPPELKRRKTSLRLMPRLFRALTTMRVWRGRRRRRHMAGDLSPLSEEREGLI